MRVSDSVHQEWWLMEMNDNGTNVGLRMSRMLIMVANDVYRVRDILVGTLMVDDW